jgi:hypothetical protein
LGRQAKTISAAFATFFNRSCAQRSALDHAIDRQRARIVDKNLETLREHAPSDGSSHRAYADISTVMLVISITGQP